MQTTRMNLFCLGVFKLSRGEDIPISIHASRFSLSVINQDAICGIRPKNKCVEVCQLVRFTLQILLDRVILALVGDYNMELLCLCTT